MNYDPIGTTIATSTGMTIASSTGMTIAILLTTSICAIVHSLLPVVPQGIGGAFSSTRRDV